jgi:hypothetical protein
VGDAAVERWKRFGQWQDLNWDATRKQWQTTWQDQAITLELNDDGAEDLETITPIFEAALKLEPNARQYLTSWVEPEVPELSEDEIVKRLVLFHLGCEADGIIWFVYKTGDLFARSDQGVMVTLHDDGRFGNIRFLERN